MTDDRDLWERIRGRDAGAFEAFYRDNAGRLCAYLRQIVGNAQAAEDLMQETFTQIWRSPNGFRPELGSLRGYLFGAARKRAAEWWRKQARVPENRGEKGRGEFAEGTASFSAVADAFGRLPEEQRSLLWLREVEGQSYAELAMVLQIPLGTVKSRLFAAREELRRVASAAASQTIPEGRWRLAEPAAATNWLRKWRETMRIPRFAFALMLLAIFALSGGLALVKARPGTNGPSLLLTIKFPTNVNNGAGVVQHCAFNTNLTDGSQHCSSRTDMGVRGYLWTSTRYIKREVDRVQLAIKTKYLPESAPGARRSDVLASVPEEEYWLELDRVLEVQAAGLGTIEISGQFLDYMPAVPSRPTEPLDPHRDEFRLYYPVLIRENLVLVNMAGTAATDEGNGAATTLYSPGLGRFIFSSIAFQGAIEGKLRINQISFTLDGQQYLLVTGAPISRSEHVWVLHQPEWRPPASEPSPSGDHPMLGSGNLQHLLETK